MIHHLTNQSDQVMILHPFTGSAKDEELKRILPFLIELSKVPDIRPVNWKYLCFLERGRIPTFARSSSSGVLKRKSSLNNNAMASKNRALSVKKPFSKSESIKKDKKKPVSKLSKLNIRGNVKIFS